MISIKFNIILVFKKMLNSERIQFLFTESQFKLLLRFHNINLNRLNVINGNIRYILFFFFNY